MLILSLNPGSSTLKFALYRDDALVTKDVIEVDARGIVRAAADVITRHPADGIGCRVVHGGARFVAPVRADEAVLAGRPPPPHAAPPHTPLAAPAVDAA